MKTVLCVSELGAGLGHVAPLMRIAEAVAGKAGRRKPQIIFAVNNAMGARQAFQDAPWPILAAPAQADKNPPVFKSHSFAEILVRAGFAEKERLAAGLNSYDDLYAQVKPDLVIAEHSPTACLAARDRVPVMLVGSGYTMPPDHLPEFPALIAGTKPPRIHSVILQNVNELLAASGRKPLAHLPELLRTEERGVFGIPQLDAYGGVRREPLLGSYNNGIGHQAMPAERRIFLYAGAIPEQLEVIAQAVSKARAPVSAYLGGAGSAAGQFLKTMGAEVFDDPPALSDILARSSVVVSHGGAGLATAAMLTGRPQVVMPIHAESRITAARIEALECGLAVETVGPEELAMALDAVVNVRTFEDGAQMQAGELAKSGHANSRLEELAGKALTLL